LGAGFLTEAYLLLRRAEHTDSLAELAPMRLFHGSNTYLALLFVALAVDPFLR
jgi:protoheme IX farnesyltransferase